MPGIDAACGTRSRTVMVAEPHRVEGFYRAWFDSEGVVVRWAPASHEMSRRLDRWVALKLDHRPNQCGCRVDEIELMRARATRSRGVPTEQPLVGERID